MANKIFFLIRIVIGLIFVVSGGEKALSPVENFVYVIQGYELLPDVLARLAAHVFPWLEFLIGLFMLLGLWMDWTLKALMLVSASFILMVGQAILRHLPLDNCGCFGSLIHLPLKGVIVLDSCILLSAIASLKNVDKARWLSLDVLYTKKT